MSSISAISRPHSKKHHGFTLVEVILAMFILAVVFGGAISSSLRTYRNAYAAKATFRATSLINTQMETLRALSFDTLTARLNNSQTNQGTVSDINVVGSRSLSWKAEKTGGDADFLEVKITVSWQEQQRPRQLSSISYFYRNGLANKSTSS